LPKTSRNYKNDNGFDNRNLLIYRFSGHTIPLMIFESFELTCLNADLIKQHLETKTHLVFMRRGTFGAGRGFPSFFRLAHREALPDLAAACLELAAWNMARYRGRIGVTGNCGEAASPPKVARMGNIWNRL
jgi:hypothetical protein